MALTYTATLKKGPLTFGSKKLVEVEIDITEYATNGVALTATKVLDEAGLNVIELVLGGGVSDLGYVLDYDAANGAIKAYEQDAEATSKKLVETAGGVGTDRGARRFWLIGH